jgi:hypothetical protein
LYRLTGGDRRDLDRCRHVFLLLKADLPRARRAHLKVVQVQSPARGQRALALTIATVGER